MSTIIFHNAGALDIRGATTMGLSAKENEASAIGKFGTGLKYGIASVLRWGGSIQIETGAQIYKFAVKNISFRGKDHQQIIMTRPDGSEQELGYTTHYGSHWEPWQIFREFYSNARDEGGGVCRSLNDDWIASEGTIITIDCKEVAECYAERNVIILDRPGEMSAVEHVRVSKIPSSYLYYRDVRVEKQKCLATWNLLDKCQLTEDRTLANDWYYGDYCAQAIQASTDTSWIRKMLTAAESYFEGGFSYTAWNTYSQEFVAIAEEIWKSEGTRALKAGVLAILQKEKPYVDAPVEHVLTKIQQNQLDKARAFLRQIAMPVDDYEVKVVGFQKNTLGMAKDGTVFLSPSLFEQGTKQIVSTWYEELVHLSTGLKDNCYEMQTYLFNRIISLHEEILGEAI